MLGPVVIIDFFRDLKKFFTRSDFSDQNHSGEGPSPGASNPDLVSLYFDFRPNNGNLVVDETTWVDLSMDRVFQRIDYTSSIIGSQILYDRLRTYESSQAILDNNTRLYEIFRKNPDLSRHLRSELKRLATPGAALLTPLLLNPLPEVPSYWWIFPICSLLSILFWIGTLIFGKLLLPSILILVLNLIINDLYGKRITPYYPAFRHLTTLLQVCDSISRVPSNHPIPDLEYLETHRYEINSLRRSFRWLGIDRSKHGEITSLLIGYLNLFLLIDIIIFLWALPKLKENHQRLITLLRTVGSLDASLSTSTYIDTVNVICTPEFSSTREIDVTEISHPLLQNPKRNCFQLINKSGLITGSNMAGKTTFIRTIGINLILSQTLHICLASHARIPKIPVYSSIRREDKLHLGESYYLSEIKRILEFIATGDQASPSLYLIDEIFRGTNTIERLACSTAVLNKLGDSNLVLVTTHDTELRALLSAGSFESFYFSESFDTTTLKFDYQIHSGVTNARNAIKLLSFCGYPAQIINEACHISHQLNSLLDQRA